MSRSQRDDTSLAFRAALEITLQAFERHARSAARKPPPGEVIVLNILDLTQDRLAREMALAAAGFLGERVEPLLDFRWQTKSEHLEPPVCHACIASGFEATNRFCAEH